MKQQKTDSSKSLNAIYKLLSRASSAKANKLKSDKEFLLTNKPTQNRVAKKKIPTKKTPNYKKVLEQIDASLRNAAARKLKYNKIEPTEQVLAYENDEFAVYYKTKKGKKAEYHREEDEEEEEETYDLATAEIYDVNNDLSDSGESDAHESDLTYQIDAEMASEDAAAAASLGPYNRLNSNRLNDEIYMNMPISEYQAYGKSTDRLIFDGEETFGMDNNIDKSYDIKTRANSYGKPTEDPRKTYYLGLLANQYKEEKSDEYSGDEEADTSKYSTHNNQVNTHYPSTKSTNTSPYNNLNSNRLNEELYGHMPIDEYQAYGKNTDRLIFDGEETFGMDNNVEKAYEIKTRANSYGKPVEDPRETYYLGLLANKKKNDQQKSMAKLKTLNAALKQPSISKTRRY